MDLLSKQAYEDSWQALNRYLRLVEQRAGLGAALHGLNRHQIQTGFIRDQLGELKRYFFPAPDNSGRFFTVQYNSARSYRHQGAGRPQTEATEWAVNGGCFLFADNIWWQQSGTESGYHLPGPLDRYTAWMNPFPLAPAHAIIGSRKHQPQHWGHIDGLTLEQLISDLVDLSDRLSNWLCFYDGVGAGASIPHHLHFHVLPRPEAHSQFPLEHAACRSQGLGNVVTQYPLPAVH